MAPESITKRYIIKDDATCQKLIEDLEAAPAKKHENNTAPDSYERELCC